MNYGDNNGARGERDRNKPRVVAGLRDVHKSGERIHGHWATAIDHFARNKKTPFPISTRISEIATPFLSSLPPFFFPFFFFFFYTYPDAFHWPARDTRRETNVIRIRCVIDRRSCNGNGTDPWKRGSILTFDPNFKRNIENRRSKGEGWRRRIEKDRLFDRSARCCD